MFGKAKTPHLYQHNHYPLSKMKELSSFLFNFHWLTLFHKDSRIFYDNYIIIIAQHGAIKPSILMIAPLLLSKLKSSFVVCFVFLGRVDYLFQDKIFTTFWPLDLK